MRQKKKAPPVEADGANTQEEVRHGNTLTPEQQWMVELANSFDRNHGWIAVFPMRDDQRAMLVAWIWGANFAAQSNEHRKYRGAWHKSRTSKQVAMEARVGVQTAQAALDVLRYVPEAIKPIIAGRYRLPDLKWKVNERKATGHIPVGTDTSNYSWSDQEELRKKLNRLHLPADHSLSLFHKGRRPA
jgi:hypothetical protein